MLEYLKEILLLCVFAGVCALLSYVVREYKQRILSVAADLIQKAEVAVQGSSMGATKKAKVIAQLEAQGIKVNAWLSDQIDNIVKMLNAKSAWLTSQATTVAKDALEKAGSEQQ